MIRARLKKRAVTGLSEVVSMKKPPRCPYCKERLVKVRENNYSTYVFDPTSGTYKVDDGMIEMFCPSCNASLREQFPQGVCNYSMV